MTGASFHECPKVGCRRRVTASMLACKTHWFQVSAGTRRAVWDAWKSADTDAHRVAVADAIEEMNR